MDTSFALFMLSFPEHRVSNQFTVLELETLQAPVLVEESCLVQAAHLQAKTMVRDTLWHLTGCLYFPALVLVPS